MIFWDTFAYLRYDFTSNGFLLPYAKVLQYTTHISGLSLLLYDSLTTILVCLNLRVVCGKATD